MEVDAHARRKKLLHEHYLKIDMRVEIAMRNYLRNNDIYYCGLTDKSASPDNFSINFNTLKHLNSGHPFTLYNEHFYMLPIVHNLNLVDTHQ